MVRFTNTYNTFNNNKSSLAPKKLRNSPLNYSALSLLEDVGDIVVMPSTTQSVLFYKLTKSRLRRLRTNSLNSNISKAQLTNFIQKKKAPMYVRHKSQVFRY